MNNSNKKMHQIVEGSNGVMAGTLKDEIVATLRLTVRFFSLTLVTKNIFVLTFLTTTV